MDNHNKLECLNYMEMGNRIRKQRENLHMTREELAGSLGVSSKFVADVEYGAKGVSIKNLYLLIQILGISADYILAGSRDETIDGQSYERIMEKILIPLEGCSVEQLQCMEQIVKFFVEGIKQE